MKPSPFGTYTEAPIDLVTDSNIRVVTKQLVKAIVEFVCPGTKKTRALISVI